MIYQIQEMNREDIARLATEALAILPTASMEQHGPHLPIKVDTALVGEVVRRAIPAIRIQRPVFVLPVLPYGHSDHHFSWAGALSLRTDTYLNVVRDISRSLIHQGTRRILIVNGHGGNESLNGVAVMEARTEHDVDMAAFSYWNFDRDALIAAVNEGFGNVPGHAGDMETSCMLASHPGDVADDWRERVRQAIEAAKHDGGPRFAIGSPAGPRPLGFTDDSGNATPEIGKKLLDCTAAAMAEYINERFGP